MSRHFLYSDEETRKAIEEQRGCNVDNEINRRARFDKTAKSKNVIIEAKDKRIAKVEEENKRLKAELAILRGMVYATSNSNCTSGTCTCREKYSNSGALSSGTTSFKEEVLYMDIFEYIECNSTNKLIENVKSRNREKIKKQYVNEIYKNKYEKNKISLKKIKKTENKQFLEWFEWTQCENPAYNKFYEKLITDAKENIDLYKKFYNILHDNISKEVFKDILKWKVTLGSQHLVRAFYMTDNEQYFEPFEYLTDQETFVDCGGFIGDSTQALLDYCGGLRKVYLYEADTENIEKAKRTLKNVNIVFRNVGVGDLHSFIPFAQTGLSSSSFTEINSNQNVEMVSIDDDINDKVTFIKMDIEGFELKALQGAKNHIINDRPCLAICLYHKPEDMWELPLYINNLVDSYNYYIRHYTLYHGETVLYAVPKERNLSV